MEQNKGRSRDIYTKIVTILLIVISTMTIVNLFNSNKRELAINDNHKWDKLLLILDQVDKNYVDSIDHKELIEKILPSLMENLDPHSIYLPPVELKEADETLQGNFSGIGIQFNVPADTAIVINVIPGGPSEKIGLLSGDKIIKVDGETVAGIKMNQDSLIKRLKGPKGSLVNVEIMRDHSPELISFEIKRDKIPVKSLDVALMIDETTGYIKLSKFTKSSYEEFKEAMEKLSQLNINNLVFDLRDNTGGYLDQALLLSNEFLSKSEMIVYMEGLHRKRQEFKADGRGNWKDVNLYVLVDENSASSSEIFAGAIQDNDRGTIIGRRSYGKGLVQEPIYFTDKSGVRLTTARFYTPSGRSIQKPYSKDYRYDIYQRYKDGELMDADSIKVNDSLKFTTKGGRTVYGGGGIIPDVFVPIDTVGVTDFYIASNRKSLPMKYSAEIADKYVKELRDVKNLEDLDKLFSKINIEKSFLAYAKKNGVKPKGDDWEVSKEVIVPQLKGLIGRYSILDDEAFYTYFIEIDNVIDEVKKQIKR